MERREHEPSRSGLSPAVPLPLCPSPGVLLSPPSRPKRCVHCPLADGRPCPGQDAHRLCMLVNPGRPEYTPGYIAAIRDLAQSRATDGPIPPESPDLAEALSLLAAMKACPFRAVDTACGCAGARCGLREDRSFPIPSVSIACEGMGATMRPDELAARTPPPGQTPAPPEGESAQVDRARGTI